MATYLITGAAGFIAAQVAARLLTAGHRVVGVDNLNTAYDRRLKDWRVAQLRGRAGFAFRHLDITNRAGLGALAAHLSEAAGVIHLAARAGDALGAGAGTGGAVVSGQPQLGEYHRDGIVGSRRAAGRGWAPSSPGPIPR